MIFDDIKALWKTGRSWSEIKEAHEVFENSEDLEEFFKSNWSLKDVREFKEMCETNPIAQKEKVETTIKNVETNTKDPEVNLGAFAKTQEDDNPFKRLAKEE